MKQAIIDGDGEGVASECVVEENGLKRVDLFAKETLVTIVLVREYTNIEFDDTVEDDELLDVLIESGVIEMILEEVPDAEKFIDFLEDRIDQEIEMFNSLTGVLARGLEKLVSKIPDDINAKTIEKWIKSVPKIMDKISPENKEMIKMAMTQKG
jgi:hypothetical protein